MKTKFLTHSLVQGLSFAVFFTTVILHILSSLLNFLFNAALVYAGYYLLTNSTAWYLSVIGFFLILDIINLLIPFIQLLVALVLLVCIPFERLYKYLVARRDLKEFSEDLTLLKEIAYENLSRDTFDSLHISDFSRNILDMYDHFLLVLVWTWIEHLRITKRNTELFISLFQQRFPSVSSLYDDLLPDMEFHFLTKSIEDGLYLYTPSSQEDFRLHIAYAITWSSKHLFRDDPDYLSFARVLSDSIKPFLETNNL